MSAPERRQRPLRVSRASDTAEAEAHREAERVVRGTPAEVRPPLGIPPPGGATRSGTAEPEADLVGRLGPGHPLGLGARSDLERRFGRDLTGVRLHTGAGADAARATLRARAFAIGEHVAIGAADAGAASSTGRRLLAHEIAHVVRPPAEPMIQRWGEDDVCLPEDDVAPVCFPEDVAPLCEPGPNATCIEPPPTSTGDPGVLPGALMVPAADDTGTPGDVQADRDLVAAHATRLRQLYADKAAFVAGIATSGPDVDSALADFDVRSPNAWPASAPWACGCPVSR